MPKFYEIPADYMQSLPWVFQGIKEMEELAKIINPYLDGLNAAVKKDTDNANVLYANEEGIARWETILGVSPPIGGSLEERRNASLAKLRSRGIINLDALRDVVETYLGVPVEIEYQWNAQNATWAQVKEAHGSWGKVKARRWGDFYRTGEPYVIHIYYKGVSKLPDLAPLYEMLYDLIPANLVVKVMYKYQTWGEAQAKYGSWSQPKGQSWNTLRMGNKTT